MWPSRVGQQTPCQILACLDAKGPCRCWTQARAAAGAGAEEPACRALGLRLGVGGCQNLAASRVSRIASAASRASRIAFGGRAEILGTTSADAAARKLDQGTTPAEILEAAFLVVCAGHWVAAWLEPRARGHHRG